MTTQLHALTPAIVQGFENGIGSFFTISLSPEKAEPYRLWIYMCEWAFLVEETEFARDDVDGIGQSLDLTKLLGARLERIDRLDDGLEYHFHFSGGFRLEIWSRDTAYESDRALFTIVRKSGDSFSVPRDVE